MVTAASAPRNTAILTVAPSQNTAPVHEFRCLYTRDLHKKAKKWHDGSLRFHTFNRRVMVYDDAKNYIGDLHYRPEEEFGEGVEIQLDRGVKVEVGERLGETETDLAPILERHRPEKTASQARQAVQASRTPSSGLSQRPKSLLEVLGPSQGRLGRSRLPIQSPYEQRNTFARAGMTAPSPKRRRLSADKEDHSDEVVQPIRPSPSCLPQPLQSTGSARISNPRLNTPTRAQVVLDISSDEDTPEVAPRATGVSALHVAGQKKPTEKSGPLSKPAASGEPRGQMRGNCSSTRSPKAPKPKATAQHAPQVAVGTVSRSSRSAINRSARLLLARPKPRPKLTLLLPLTKDPETWYGPVSSAETPTSQHSAVAPADDPPEQEAEVIDYDLDSPSTPANIHPGEIVDIDSSPLFVPEGKNAAQKSPSPKPLSTQEEFPGLSASSEHLHGSQSQISQPAVPPLSGINEPSAALETLTHDDLASPPPIRASPTDDPVSDLQDFALPSGPAADRGISPSRDLRRSFPENDAPEEGDEDDLMQVPAQVAIQTRSPLQLLSNLATRQSPVKLKSPSKIQRCASDTAALDGGVDNRGRVEIREKRKEEKGPWTTEEAFVLFDWWPPEVTKPEYWAATADKAASRAVVPGAAGTAYPTMITTARQFLRDDVNAL